MSNNSIYQPVVCLPNASFKNMTPISQSSYLQNCVAEETCVDSAGRPRTCTYLGFRPQSGQLTDANQIRRGQSNGVCYAFDQINWDEAAFGQDCVAEGNTIRADYIPVYVVPTVQTSDGRYVSGYVDGSNMRNQQMTTLQHFNSALEKQIGSLQGELQQSQAFLQKIRGGAGALDAMVATGAGAGAGADPAPTAAPSPAPSVQAYADSLGQIAKLQEHISEQDRTRADKMNTDIHKLTTLTQISERKNDMKTRVSKLLHTTFIVLTIMLILVLAYYGITKFRTGTGIGS